MCFIYSLLLLFRFFVQYLLFYFRSIEKYHSISRISFTIRLLFNFMPRLLILTATLSVIFSLIQLEKATNCLVLLL